jgi:hypothetical protein
MQIIEPEKLICKGETKPEKAIYKLLAIKIYLI